MAKPNKDAQLKEHWICTDCGKASIGQDPPDRCPWCAHEFFDNLQDLVNESAGLQKVYA